MAGGTRLACSHKGNFIIVAQTVLILGGGFGGLAAASEVRRLLPSDTSAIVVDRSDDFVVGGAKTRVAPENGLVGGASSFFVPTFQSLKPSEKAFEIHPGMIQCAEGGHL